jgi:ferrous iron transport protein A
MVLLIRLNQNNEFVVATSNTAKQLVHLNAGKGGFVSHFTNTQMACKLMSMGILPGSRVELIRFAPFGGGCYVKADNLLIALRKEEATSIILR